MSSEHTSPSAAHRAAADEHKSCANLHVQVANAHDSKKHDEARTAATTALQLSENAHKRSTAACADTHK